jgi:hypothetical protein
MHTGVQVVGLNLMCACAKGKLEEGMEMKQALMKGLPTLEGL